MWQKLWTVSTHDFHVVLAVKKGKCFLAKKYHTEAILLKRKDGVIMTCTYEEYLKQPKAITFEKMQMIHAEMLAEIGAGMEALELYDELIKVATRYAAIRANWLLLSREEKNEQDSGRTSCHNSVITHFNMMARYLKQQGKAAAWRDELGYEEDNPYNRKAIGDFACYLAFVNGINAG